MLCCQTIPGPLARPLSQLSIRENDLFLELSLLIILIGSGGWRQASLFLIGTHRSRTSATHLHADHAWIFASKFKVKLHCGISRKSHYFYPFVSPCLSCHLGLLNQNNHWIGTVSVCVSGCCLFVCLM